MATPIPTVKPGDLITAAAFNLVAQDINELLNRVALLESILPGTGGGGTGTGPTPVGSLVVTPVPTNQGAILVGQTYTFPFVLDSQTQPAESYTVTVVYNQPIGASAAAWSALTSVRNQSNQPITSVTIASGSPVTINVQVTIPAGAVSANLTLQVRSIHAPADPLLNVTQIVPITVGQAVPVSDPRVHFEQLLVAPANRLGTDPQLGQVIACPVAGTVTLVRISADFDVAGNYDFSAAIVPSDPTRWSAALNAATPANAAQGPGNPRQIIVELNALTADNLPSRMLEIHAAKTAPGETFDAWFPIAIRNA